ncbi:hypothetical protein CsatB_002430 [Cannabis sativa]
MELTLYLSNSVHPHKPPPSSWTRVAVWSGSLVPLGISVPGVTFQTLTHQRSKLLCPSFLLPPNSSAVKIPNANGY